MAERVRAGRVRRRAVGRDGPRVGDRARGDDEGRGEREREDVDGTGCRAPPKITDTRLSPPSS